MSSGERQKMRKGQFIATNWRCDVQESIPARIRPRIGAYKGHKVKVGATVPEAPWAQWSLELLSELETLSSMTVGRLLFAQELMTMEVQQRQQDWTSNRKDFAEILRSDLKKINQDLKERALENGIMDDSDDNDNDEDEDVDEDVDEDEGDVGNEVDNHKEDAHKENGYKEDGNEDVDIANMDEREQEDRNEDHNPNDDGNDKNDVDNNEIEEKNATPIKRETKIKPVPIDDVIEMITVDEAPTKVATVPAFRKASKTSLKTQARIATLRAEAMRLRQVAATREAQAYELEARMLTTEAKTIDLD